MYGSGNKHFPLYQVKQSLQKLCTVLENKGNWKELVNNFREFFFYKDSTDFQCRKTTWKIRTVSIREITLIRYHSALTPLYVFAM